MCHPEIKESRLRVQQRGSKAWTEVAEPSKEEGRKEIKPLFQISESIINVHAKASLTVTSGILPEAKLSFINKVI